MLWKAAAILSLIVSAVALVLNILWLSILLNYLG